MSELLSDPLVPSPLSVGRVEVAKSSDAPGEDVLTLEEVAAPFKRPPEAIQAAIKKGQLPGRRFGEEWRFAKIDRSLTLCKM